MEQITITATVAAPIQRVWDCYTQPDHITKWNFASDDWHCPSATNDMRVGGTYCARMEAKDGSMGFDLAAIYDEIKEGEYFSFHMADRRVAVSFNQSEHGTTVTISFDPEQEHSLEMQRQGWQAILNNFKRYVEASS